MFGVYCVQYACTHARTGSVLCLTRACFPRACFQAEYHGRIDRRDKRIEALTARLADGGGGKGGGAPEEDKENARPRVNMA